MPTVSSPLTHYAASAPCAVCGAPGRPCSRCRVHYYCGKQHQQQHWALHKPGCGSVELRGNVLVATRKIPAHTVILREQASLVLPPAFSIITQNPFLNVQFGAGEGTTSSPSFSQVLCAGCCKDLATRQRPGQARQKPTQCPRCGLPVCNVACSESSQHQVECKELQKAKFVVPWGHVRDSGVVLGAVVATLRAAAAIRSSPQLQRLTVGLDEYSAKMTPFMVGTLAMIHRVVQYLRKTAKVTSHSEKELETAGLMVAVYGRLTPPEQPEQGFKCLLFAGMSLRKHSCIPNSESLRRLDDGDRTEYLTFTTVDVAAGECITTAREGANWVDHTRDRKESLRVRWGFECDCKRCSDPTELGMYVGSPCCRHCTGNGTQSYLLSNGDVWICNTCKVTVPESEVVAMTKPAKDKLFQLIGKGSPPFGLMDLIKEFSYPRGPLHPTHAVMLHAKEAFRNCFNEDGFEVVELIGVDYWESVLREQLRALDHLLPGKNTWRSTMLGQLRFMVLDRLHVAVREKPWSRENDRDIEELKAAVLDLNEQLAKYELDSVQLKAKLLTDPFSGVLD